MTADAWPSRRAWVVTIDWGHSDVVFLYATDERARLEYGWLRDVGSAKQAPGEVALWAVDLPEAGWTREEVYDFCHAHCPYPSEVSPVRKLASQGSSDGWMLVPIPDDEEEAVA